MKNSPFTLLNKHQKTGAYALDCVTSAQNPQICGLLMSNGSIDIHDSRSLSHLSTIQQPVDNVVSQIMFDKVDSNVLWVSNLNGNICAFDLRQPLLLPAVCLTAPNTILSFDIDASHTKLCAGTELNKEDAPILIYDLRNPQSIERKFEDCHSDDITQIKYHPNNPNVMISGSTDGLCCLYDMSQSEEDEALYMV